MTGPGLPKVGQKKVKLPLIRSHLILATGIRPCILKGKVCRASSCWDVPQLYAVNSYKGRQPGPGYFS